MSTTLSPASEATANEPRWLRGAATAVGRALALNLVAFGLALAAGVDVVIPASPGATDLASLSIGLVIGATVVPLLAGTAILFGLLRFTARPIAIWRTAALGVAVLSMGPILQIDAGTANAVSLAVLHLLTGVVAAFVLPRAAGVDDGAA